MSRIIFFTDPHNSDTPPRMRKDSYREEILEKQVQVLGLIEEYHPDLVVCGGDVFHQTRPDRVSYKLVNQLCEVYREMGQMVIVPGNHDLIRRGEFNSAPLCTFSFLPNVKISHAEVLEYDDFVLFTFDGVELYPEGEFLDWLDEVHVGSIGCKKPKVGAFHQPVRAKEWDASSFPFPMVSPEKIYRYMDVSFIGHIHQTTYNDGRIVFPGALSRGVLNSDELDRKVCVAEALINGNTIVVELHEIACLEGERVFKVVEKVREMAVDKGVKDFLEFIDTFDLPKSLTVEDTIAAIEALAGLDKAVVAKAIAILKGL